MSDFWTDLAPADTTMAAPPAESPATPAPADLTPCGLLENDTEECTPAQARAMAISVRALDMAAHASRLADICREALNRAPRDKYLAASVVWCEDMANQFRDLAAKQRDRLA
jgi:hypothetical protein